jgi:hypothetical protein
MSQLPAQLLKKLIERGVRPCEIILCFVELIERVVEETTVGPDERVEVMLDIANMLVERSHGVLPVAYLAREEP